MPHELFERPAFSITPEPGRSGPKLWVRRLVIWRDPKTVIRDIPLRPGLNVVWSPDGSDGDAAIGHGGGKSTFCRLLRFCLGEDTFGPDALRQRIADVFPKGHVGAEVMLDGSLWIVVRSLGVRRRDFVQEGGQLEDAFSEDAHPTGIAPLLGAIKNSVLGSSAALAPRSIGPDGAWKAVLAWMTRDQECRLASPLEWRSSTSDSRSPVVNRSGEDKLIIIRAAINALSKNEIDSQAKEEKLRDELTRQRSLISHLEWQIGRHRRDLRSALGESRPATRGVSGTSMDVVLWKKAADEQLANALNLPGRVNVDDVQAARRNRDSEKEERDRLKNELVSIKSEITRSDEMKGVLRAELPEAYAQLAKDGTPVCPICKIPIDTVKAKGCGISIDKCDIRKQQAEIELKLRKIDELERTVPDLRKQESNLNKALGVAEHRYQEASKILKVIENSFDSSRKTIRAAQKVRSDVNALELTIAEAESARLKEKKIEAELKKTGETVAAFRNSSSDTIARLSTWFDAVLQELVPGVARGTVKVDGNGLSLNIKWGGDRRSAAIDSLKIVIFDLAALVMSMEKSLFLPGLLVHDSPREADLSETPYGRIFRFAAMLEKCSKTPYFQYIVTTTTKPPEEFQQTPWLCLKVKGAPAADRLLGVDL